jgi:cytochrome c-type biogenesis protein CcmF
VLAAEEGLQSAVSREATILVNNLLFVAITFTVLLGTLWPVVNDALRGVRVSVGEPYFNAMAVPGGLAVLFLMGVGPALPWGASEPGSALRQLGLPALVGAAAAAVCAAFGLRGTAPLVTFGLGGFALAVTLRELFLPAWIRMAEKRESALTAVVRSAQRARRRTGGYIVHIGVILVFAGVAASSAYKQHLTGTLKVGEDKTLSLGGYTLALKGLERGQEPHRTFVATRLLVTAPSGATEEIAPRMNFYERSTDPVPTPAVRSRAHEDLYVSLLAVNDAGDSASFNVWVFPLVAWIWGSLPFIVLGSLIAAWPSRRKAAAERAGGAVPLPAGEDPAGGATQGAA